VSSFWGGGVTRSPLQARAALALASLILEAAIGYPTVLLRLAPHPVAAPAFAIDVLERRWNRPDRSDRERRVLGALTIALVVGGAAAAGLLATRLARRREGSRRTIRAAALTLLATTGLAQRSLNAHVAAVLAPLERGELPAARAAVARIVGRDVAALDAAGVAAAALESLAESFNDGVLAPAFWLAAAGPTGLFAYKAVNTADSLIGHREARWRDFGWAAARTDDAMNLLPARLGGALIALAAGRGWRIMLRDAPKHASPNAGWPEAAMAGALGVSLGGPARYDGVLTQRPKLGDGPTPTADDLRRGLGLYRRACALLWLGMGALAWRR
jgi:adenosylcobinamide-phosphate synthase